MILALHTMQSYRKPLSLYEQDVLPTATFPSPSAGPGTFNTH